MLHQAVVLHDTKRENYSWHSACLCSFSICVIIAESFEHSMHLTENETTTYCGLMKRTEGNVPSYWLTGSCFINAFSHLFSPSPYINSFSLMPVKCWAQCFRASLNSPASAHEWLQPPCPGFGSSHGCMTRKDMLLCKHTPIHGAWWEQGQLTLESVPNINNFIYIYIHTVNSAPNNKITVSTGSSSPTLRSLISMELLSD